MNLINIAEKLESMLQELLKSPAVDGLPSGRKLELERIGEKIRVVVADLEAVDQWNHAFRELYRES